MSKMFAPETLQAEFAAAVASLEAEVGPTTAAEIIRKAKAACTKADRNRVWTPEELRLAAAWVMEEDE